MFFSNNNFEHIYITYADMVYRICFLSLKNKTDAEDAVQEVFMKLLKNQAKIKDEYHLKYWLIRVTQNLCKDIIKKIITARTNIFSIFKTVKRILKTIIPHM